MPTTFPSKYDARPLPGGADPDGYVRAADMQAAYDAINALENAEGRFLFDWNGTDTTQFGGVVYGGTAGSAASLSVVDGKLRVSVTDLPNGSSAAFPLTGISAGSLFEAYLHYERGAPSAAAIVWGLSLHNSDRSTSISLHKTDNTTTTTMLYQVGGSTEDDTLVGKNMSSGDFLQMRATFQLAPINPVGTDTPPPGVVQIREHQFDSEVTGFLTTTGFSDTGWSGEELDGVSLFVANATGANLTTTRDFAHLSLARSPWTDRSE